MRGRGYTSGGASSKQMLEKETFTIDDEISHLTKIRSEPCENVRRAMPNEQKKLIPMIKMLSGREFNYSGKGRFSLADCSHLLGRCLPINLCGGEGMDSEAYVSQFSSDGSLFIVGCRRSHIRIYNVDRGWKVQKDISARSLRWTITDTSLSPDKRFLVYSSLSPIVHIVNVGTPETESRANVTDIHEGLDFSDHADSDYSFGIFSVKFSTDGRELVAGSNGDSIHVYDLEANKMTLQIPAHTADVNTVTFADETGHLIFSGSDDNLCKVWDRRCFTSTGKPEGILTGHLEGITFIDSRGDGRYFISNGKDQTTKLWDIRRMSSTPKFSTPKRFYWDYRWDEYPAEARRQKHSSDQSLATYRGHSVLCTLIRCYFSPAYSTGQKYIYTGSNDGCVYIYDVVTGVTVARLERHAATVRDCSWHPYFPMLVSSSWDCSIARWEFPGNDEDPGLPKKKARRRRSLRL
ncbi:LEC14B homolog [Elaeis guineensis]|uniref:LEC14B homolog n=1 Tax=Elaeis guineensis var. tenera TaxID=51953 RepID=A0A6I9QSP0_ELAGV|nr:LEC14B homolog [Elaeis guineensis]XP_010914358.1 LEC14B homolog [Elaeis guineensis]XP_010914359.1 LEC14B homolog [Elaeis guineensis]XP_010914360.1 LEC14B homolog [Elaeis guineensis]